jgi:cell division protein FtsN
VPPVRTENFTGDQSKQQPLTITVNNYLGKPENFPNLQTGTGSQAQAQVRPGLTDAEFLAWLTAMTMDAREAREARESREAREARESREARETRWMSAAQVYAPPAVPATPQSVQGYQPAAPQSYQIPALPAGDVQIIPGLPDPNSNRFYHLQVGAFVEQNVAIRTVQQIQAIGFYAGLEQIGNVYRVLVLDIPAANVYTAAVRLGAAGFRQVWVRE